MSRIGRTRRTPRVLAAGIAILLIAFGIGFVASGAAQAPPTTVHLHLGSDGRFFQYGSTVQTLTTQSNNCKINSAEPVMHLASTGSQSAPGLNGTDIGVKGTPSSGNGTPCGQVDGTETLTLTPGTAIAGRTFTGLRMDLEMTGNAVVKLTLANGSTSSVYQLQTGTSVTVPPQTTSPPYFVTSGPGDTLESCAAPNSSGPNNGSNDNCEWTVTPGFNFNSATLTTGSAGTVSLEGSNDFGNDPAFDTVFFLSNSAPTPVNDSITTNEDTAVSGNVLSNDTDPEGNSLTASLVTGPAHGTLTLDASGAFTYTPALNYNGADSFVYAASDGLLSTNATANITVVPVNDPPVAVGSSVTTPEDTPLTITVASDIDSTVINVGCTPSSGVVNNGDGTITFTPPLNFDGTVSLTCTATDDQGATSASSVTVDVTTTPVNDPPVANGDTAQINENIGTPINVAANDTDVDGPFPLTATNVQSISPTGSTATPNPDGTVTFTPPTDYTGPASFTYQAQDGAGATSSNTATVAITVVPVICSDQTVQTANGDVSGSFTRLSDGSACKAYQLTSSAADGTVLFKPTGADIVSYRGFVNLGPPNPTDPSGTLADTLRYDPTGGTNYRPVPWCVNPQFDADHNVTDATIPTGDTWCIASATTVPDSSGVASTTWQVFGHDDPRLTH